MQQDTQAKQTCYQLTLLIKLSTIRNLSVISLTIVDMLSSPVLTIVGPNTIARFRTSIFQKRIKRWNETTYSINKEYKIIKYQ